MTYSASRLTLYAVISSIEDDLRRALLFHLGAEGNAKSILGDSLHARSVERYLKEHEGGSDATIEEVLPYIDFADAYQTLNAHASKLPKPVAQFLSRTVSRFERIAAVRNRVAHGRPLLFDDFARTLDSAEEFLGNGALPWSDLRTTLARLKSEPSFVLSLSIPEYRGNSKHNLPVPDFDETGFIGRREEIEDVKKLCLGPYPVVTIVGEGGLGKTALALKVAYDLLDSPACPFESVVWSSSKTNQLTGPEITKIQNAISDSLGLLTNVADRLAGSTAGEPIEEVLEYLKQFRILLVLDNLETVIDARIRGFLQRLPTGSKILITSRIGLGAFEVPFKLNPLARTEAVQLLRALAKTRGITYLEKLSSARLTTYCDKMHLSPGFIRWFVSAVQAGRRPEEVLARPDIFLDFCLSNVYKYLSDLSKKVLRCMLCVPTPSSHAELSFLTELDFLDLQTAIQQLLTTNMIVMSSLPTGSSFESRYALSDLPREYLLKHHPVDKDEYAVFSKRKQQMISQGEKILAEVRTNPFGTSTIDIRSRSDLIVARYLIDAIAETDRGNFVRASTAVGKARELAPEYFEVWRVEAILHEGEQNFPAALQSYQAAVELEPSSIKVRHALGRFFLLTLGDHDAAIEQFTAALALDSQCVEVQLDLVRAYLYSMRFEQARHLLDGLMARVGGLTRVEHRSKAYDLHLQYFTRKAEFHQAVEDSADAALREYENLLSAFGKIPPIAVDTHMKKHLAKAFPSACRCENDLSDDAQRKRLEPIVTWLSEFELPMLGPHSPKRQRLRGKVARVFKFKKFGFITRAGGEELFVHQGQFLRRSEWSAVAEGVEVEFEIGSNTRGECATRVRVVDTLLENAATGKDSRTDQR
jgi:LuxR family glucitol operon transcriptional activator